MGKEASTDEQLTELLQRYLTILQAHTTAEHMIKEILTPDFETGFIGGQIWTGIDGLRDGVSEEFTGTCFHTWRVREEDGEWRVAAQLVERFTDLNDNAKRLFSTPEEGLNR